MCNPLITRVKAYRRLKVRSNQDIEYGKAFRPRCQSDGIQHIFSSDNLIEGRSAVGFAHNRSIPFVYFKSQHSHSLQGRVSWFRKCKNIHLWNGQDGLPCVVWTRSLHKKNELISRVNEDLFVIYIRRAHPLRVNNLTCRHVRHRTTDETGTHV